MMTDETLTPTDEAIVPTPESVDAAPDPVIAEAPVAEVSTPVATPEPAPVPAPAPATEEDDMALFAAAFDALEGGDDSSSDGGFKRLTRGDRVEATVIQVDRDKVFVNLGTKSEGVIPMNELFDTPVENLADEIKIGDKIQVVVIKPEGGEGGAVVSKKRADFEDLWDRIEGQHRDQVTVNAHVIERVKGGLVVDIGVRGFVPATHVGNGKLRNIEKYVGQAIPLKIIEIDRERKKVVLSNRQADEERRAAAKEELFVNVKPGDVMEGTVRRLTDYGAFIDLGGVDGLLHISEMSWMRIQHPKEMFKEGQKVQVMVLRLDPAIGKISLGHRQVLPDPWNLIKQNYTQNQRFTTKITRLVPSGAFVKLEEGAEAFIPLSEMSNRRIRKPEEAVEEGQEVEVQIIDLRPDERRMVLSIRAVSGGFEIRPTSGGTTSSYDDDRPKTGAKKGGKPGAKGGRGRGRDDDFDDAGRRGFATGGATIGERLGMLKGLKGLVRAANEEEEEDEGAKAAPAAEESDES